MDSESDSEPETPNYPTGSEDGDSDSDQASDNGYHDERKQDDRDKVKVETGTPGDNVPDDASRTDKEKFHQEKKLVNKNAKT